MFIIGLCFDGQWYWAENETHSTRQPPKVRWFDTEAEAEAFLRAHWNFAELDPCVIQAKFP